MLLPTSHRFAAAAAAVACAGGLVAFGATAAQAAQPGHPGHPDRENPEAGPTCGINTTDYPGTVYGLVDGEESFTFGHSGVLLLSSMTGPDIARASGRYSVSPAGVTISFEGERTTSVFRGCDGGSTPDVLFFPVDESGIVLVRQPGAASAQLPSSVLGPVSPAVVAAGFDDDTD